MTEIQFSSTLNDKSIEKIVSPKSFRGINWKYQIESYLWLYWMEYLEYMLAGNTCLNVIIELHAFFFWIHILNFTRQAYMTYDASSSFLVLAIARLTNFNIKSAISHDIWYETAQLRSGTWLLFIQIFWFFDIQKINLIGSAKNPLSHE